MESTSPLLQTVGLTRRYPGVIALDDVSFDLHAGEVHVLFGENGAGKSTMLNMIAGAVRPSEGTIILDGEEVDFHGVGEAREAGISAVFQDFSLAPDLTVEANLELGAEPTRGGLIDRSQLRSNATKLLGRLGFDIEPTRPVRRLTRAEQQMVEIAKAFRTAPRVLILDEPTASLTEGEAERLFALIEESTQAGLGIIYVSHRIAEIERLADRVTVLRDGKKVGTIPADQADDDRLVEMMSGKQIDQVFPTIEARPGNKVVEATSMSTVGLSEASFHVAEGEVVGFAGLIGSGKSEASRVVAGAVPLLSGSVTVDGEPVEASPRAMLRRGVHYVPPDRKEEGLLMPRGSRENLAISAIARDELVNLGMVKGGAERKAVGKVETRLDIKSGKNRVSSMSGGNQQKVVLGRSLLFDRRLLILDEPTVGVDITTRSVIYDLIAEIATSGTAVILVSSDLSEILHLPSRVYVFHRGMLRLELIGDQITERNVLSGFMDERIA